MNTPTLEQFETFEPKAPFTFFWGGYLSNWYKSEFSMYCKITEQLRTFNCGEQAMMYGKAVLFGDLEIAEQIMQTSEPREQKALGRKVCNFDAEKWNRVCRQLVFQISYERFQQNPHLLKNLLGTKGTTLVEASPKDTIWGIGLGKDHLDAQHPARWRGTNFLGTTLTLLRETFLAEGVRV